MRKRQSAILLVLLLAMTVLPSCSFKQNDIIYQDNSDITVDKFEITLNLHHIGQKSGIYSGKMKDDLPNGKGSFETQNKYGTTVIYEGEWVNGQLEGQGTIIWTGDEAMSLEGNFVDSDIVKGKEFYDGVMVYDGEWKNLTYHGHGTFYNSSGDAIYSGSFENGLPSDKDKFIAAAKDVSYDELLNNPMHYIFDIIKVQGKIVYVWEGEDDYCEYMISTDESDEQTVYISYFRRSKDERHIQEGDSLTVYGISSGLYSYETTQDAIATTPNMTMFYFE